MNNGASLDGNLLRMQIIDIDKKRKQNLVSVAPELAQLIDYNGPT